MRFATPPNGPVLLTATDEVGNTSRWRMPVTLVPRLPAEPVRAVHVSADGWASSVLRQGVLRMIDDHRINAVELDLKDESGVIGWAAPVPLRRRYGAITETFDLEDAVDQLHAKGVRVIGRLVAFRDPIMAEGAWNAGNRDAGDPGPGWRAVRGLRRLHELRRPGRPEVQRRRRGRRRKARRRRHPLRLRPAAGRPDLLDGLPGHPGHRRATRSPTSSPRRGPRCGRTARSSARRSSASPRRRPFEVAQDIPKMARQVDYIAPMVYPSHWGPGEYEVDDPNSQPYDIVRRSLEDFEQKVEGHRRTARAVAPGLLARRSRTGRPRSRHRSGGRATPA